MKSKEIIQKEYPSLCYSCKKARRAASSDLEQEGYVGCTLDIDTYQIQKAEKMVSGWVDLRSAPFNKESGITTNLRLLTLKTRDCLAHTYI